MSTRTVSRRWGRDAASRELPASTPSGVWLAEGFFWDGYIASLGLRLRDALNATGYDYRPLALRCCHRGRMDEFFPALARVLHKHGITDVLSRETGVEIPRRRA